MWQSCVVFHRKVSVTGSIESFEGKLQLRIPLSMGGRQLAKFAKGLGVVEVKHLIVVIPPFLAEALNVHEGSIVIVDNAEGKFRITRSEENDKTGA
jgi:hypothetical protein